MCFIDSHTHLQFAAFKDDQEEVIARAREAGVVASVTVGTQIDTSRAGVTLAETHPDIYATVGLHPIHTHASFHDPEEVGGDGFTSRSEEFDTDAYLSLATHERVVAIGECGLDYFHIEGDETVIKNRQRETFLAQLEVAEKVQKPIMCHCRPSLHTHDAYEDLYNMIAPRITRIPGLVLHFFAGNVDVAERFSALGSFFTFGGVITITDAYDRVVRSLPVDRLMTETDAPYVAPVPHRGQRNEPSYVPFVAARMAELRDIDLTELTEQVVSTNQTVFGIKV